ncbi:hypothetical protein RRG08_008147 [Elysia crispata]|uniref:Uncharacterized protein n=1 Tax=Elysia crispata TaxID=231223 RepID=A0AAE1DA27_9GAST|nr:hypothetical protein RRG08_008147 [Elysia crispata]
MMVRLVIPMLIPLFLLPITSASGIFVPKPRAVAALLSPRAATRKPHSVPGTSRRIKTLAYVEGEYADVFDTSSLPLEQQNIAGAANDYYRMLAQDQNIIPELPDLSNFMIDEKGRLRLKDYPNINLINENDIDKRPNKLTTIARYKNGRVAIREKLGIPAWTPDMSKAAEAQLLKYNQNLGKTTESLDTGGATEAVNITQKIIAALASRPGAKNACADLDLGGEDGPHYPRERELERPRLLPRLRPRSCERSRFC